MLLQLSSIARYVDRSCHGGNMMTIMFVKRLCACHAQLSVADATTGLQTLHKRVK